MSPIRIFTAIELSNEVRSSALRLIERLQNVPAKVAWSRPENLLTLKFLGDVRADQVGEACRAIQQAALPFTPFDLVVAGVGGFPSLTRLRTIWLGTREGREPTEMLFQAIERNLLPLGIPREHRRYTPHLTLGRVRQIPSESQQPFADQLRKHAEFDASIMTVRRITVYSSVLSRSGPRYTTLAHADLEG